MADLVLLSPLPGWVMPLEEVEDEVFAGRMLGDGLAIDPTDGILRSPCDGEVTALPETAHAATLRTANGAELLLHVGIDTVALKGRGFEALARGGLRVKAGDPLLRFDLDALARGARSLVTPILVTEPERFRIVERRAPGLVGAGDALMTLRSVAQLANATDAGGTESTGLLRIALPHGLHARPAAMLAQGLKRLRAEVTLTLGDRTVNARSAVALLSLGAGRGDVLRLRATGTDAALVMGALEEALTRAAAIAAAPQTEAPSVKPAAGAVSIDDAGSGPVVAVAGVAIGPLARVSRDAPAPPERGAGVEVEMRRLDEARTRLAAKLKRVAAADAGAGAGIVGAHLEFLDDPELLAAAYRRIAEGKSAGFAWRAAAEAAARQLASLPDGHLAARADDLRDLELQLLEILSGSTEPAAPSLPAGAIVVARDLLPSQFLALEPAHIAGICTVSRAATSHVAILAGARGLPMLAGVDVTLLAAADGTTVLLDAERGRVIVDPGPAETIEAEARIAERARTRAWLTTAAALDCRTADGKRVEVFANVGSAAEAAAAVAAGAEGCGLLRTEFLFLDRREPPAMAEQRVQYQAIVNAFAGRPVVVRTLDAGGDKAIPFLAMPPQENPALGLRGIRASLWRPELLRTQLEAILSVRPADRCRILLPMVNEPAEIEAVRAMIRELVQATHGNADIPVGIMIETPAAAIAAARLAAHADFFSIGTNDLTQYLLAIDRTHPTLAGRLDALHPAVLAAIQSVCAAARAAGRSVAVCGGLASEPAAAPLLVGLGVGELSAVPAAIPAIKNALRRRTLAECRALAGRALTAQDAAAVRALVADVDGEPPP